MSEVFKVEEIDISYEKRILINIITNTKFCKEFSKIYKPGFFKNTYLDRICSWCFEFVSKYGEAPNSALVNIFENAKRKMNNPGLVNNIETFLIDINDSFVEEEDENFNLDFFLDEAKNYYKRQVFIQTLEKSIELAKRFDLYEAEALLKQRMIEDAQESTTVTLNDRRNFIDIEGSAGNLFTLSTRTRVNRFDVLTGPIKRGFLVAFMGKMKAGKSFFLLETAIQAAENNLKVILFSLEMPTREVLSRYKYRLTARGSKETEKVMTVFDCLNNQTGRCDLPQRTNLTRLFERRTNFDIFEYKILPEYNYLPNYSPCTYCREAGLAKYNPSLWFNRIKIKEYEESFGWKKQQLFNQFYKNGMIEIISFPPHTLTVEKIKAILDAKYSEKGTVFDVVVIDYPDLMKPEKKSESRHELNEIWVGLKELAMARGIGVVGGSQVNRAALKKDYLSMGDIAEDIRKAAISDVILGINQSVADKERGIVRLNCLLHRHIGFNEKKLLWCTQDLGISYPILDAEFFPNQSKRG